MEILRPKVKISRPTLYRHTRKGEGFPQPISLGETAIGYIKSEIEEWVLSRRKQAT